MPAFADIVASMQGRMLSLQTCFILLEPFSDWVSIKYGLGVITFLGNCPFG